MRIAFINEVNIHTRGGNYIHFRIAVELARRGHKVYFLYYPYQWRNYGTVDELGKHITLVEDKYWYDVWKEAEIIIWLSSIPFWVPGYREALDKISALPKRKIVYIALDYWEGWFSYTKDERIRAEKDEYALVRNSACVGAVSPQLCEYLSAKYGRKVYWIPNGAALREFTPIPVSKRNYAVIVSSLYAVRSIDDYMRLALKYADWEFFWFGCASHPQEILPTHPMKIPTNLHFCGEVSNEDLVYVLSKARIAIVPAGRNPFSYFADPTKWYLYHAARLPIVSINTPHHKRFPDIYPNTFCGVDLDETFGRAVQYGQISDNVLEFHDWSHRAYAVEKLIDEEKAIYGYAENGKFHLTLDIGGAHDEPSEKGSSGRTRSSTNSL